MDTQPYFGIPDEELEQKLFRAVGVQNRVSSLEMQYLGPLLCHARDNPRAAVHFLEVIAGHERDRGFAAKYVFNPLKRIEAQGKRHNQPGIGTAMLFKIAESIDLLPLADVEAAVSYVAGGMSDSQFYKSIRVADFANPKKASLDLLANVLPIAQKEYTSVLAAQKHDFASLSASERRLVLMRDLFYGGKWEEMRNAAMNARCKSQPFYGIEGEALKAQLEQMDLLYDAEHKQQMNYRWFATLPKDIAKRLEPPRSQTA